MLDKDLVREMDALLNSVAQRISYISGEMNKVVYQEAPNEAIFFRLGASWQEMDELKRDILDFLYSYEKDEK